MSRRAVPVVSGDLSQLSMLSGGCGGIGGGGVGGGGKEALWIDRGWRNGDKDPESKLLNGIGRETTCADYAEVDTRNLSTFYNPRKEMTSNPTPYATTTLLNRDDCNVSATTTAVDRRPTVPSIVLLTNVFFFLKGIDAFVRSR